MIQYINFATPFVLFICGIVASVIAYSIKINIADVKNNIAEIKNCVNKLDDDNTQSHKELWLENNNNKERLIRVETKINGGKQ